MALVIKDRVKESSITVGSGTYTLAGAETGFQSFASIGDGNTTYYSASDGTDWEVGIGTYSSSGTTLARTSVLSSSNGGAAVSWSAGEKLIFCSQPSSKANFLDASGYAVGTDMETHIDLNTTVANKPAHSEGRLFYDKAFGALAFYNDESDITLQIGQEDYIRVYNNTGSTISNGTPVYLTGEVSATPTVAVARADGTYAESQAAGIATHDIENSSIGYITTRGLIGDVDTSHLTVGEPVHVSVGASGGTQTASPTYPNYPTEVGICLISGSTGCIYVSIFHESFETMRVEGNAHFDADLTIDGDLTVNGTQTITNTNNISLSGAFNYFNSGDSISSVIHTGSGLDDALFTGHYKGTASNKTFKVKITTESHAQDDDFFRWSTDDFVTQSAEIEITGNDQALEDGVSVKFNAATGHTLNDVWSGTASPTNVDSGIASNRNTGTSGVGYTHMGIYYDVSSNYWTVFDAYSPEPEGSIDTSHASFSYGTIKAGTVIADLTGNVTGDVTGSLTGNASGSATSVDAGDNVKSYWGTGNDLQIYHDGDNSIIEDVGTGDLNIRANDNLRLQSATTNENFLKADSDGAVTLFYNNNHRLATSSTGVDITGTAKSTSVALGDWTITEDGNGKLAFSHSGTVKLTLDDTGTLAAANDIFTDETL